jgi:acyl carrier protein
VPDADLAAVLAELGEILAGLTGDAAVAQAPPSTPLLRTGVGLDSLGGALLLTAVRTRFGVEVADEDLNLDSLASVGTLAAFITDRITRH